MDKEQEEDFSPTKKTVMRRCLTRRTMATKTKSATPGAITR
jgi:hypothetical protein